MSAVWFTSDLHIGHTNVARSRAFRDVADHDQALAESWDRLIGPRDQVWVLGDISLGGHRAEAAALQWILGRPGIKHLVAGNHDGCHPMHREAHREQRVYLEAFASVQQTAVRRINGHRVLLSHFPFRDDPDGDHTPEIRYPEWRMPDTGQWLLHGHTHSPLPIRGRQIHVGVDAHGLRPVPLAWVENHVRPATSADPNHPQKD
ncbi:metallophosphoesterase family protein [Nocardia farcinica]|uniref:metallophosphoesterase family protein n=1 Tax=Nocardia farcinica TaxID=37329 RepID=UPI002457EA93|nr:metallophosphoesterase family protein [Nocardia farcinica]